MKSATKFDYVIVGAGSAGCVLANRLTENSNTTVVLLEAGKSDCTAEGCLEGCRGSAKGDGKLNLRIPAAFSKLFKTEYDWAYYTETQSHLNNRQLYWPRGKVLGGSSSINAMIYIRGHRCDYDYWDKLGNSGWSFSQVLPYFQKCENQERGASQYHGTGGPINVAGLRYTNPLSHAFVQAGVEIGLGSTDDFNSPEPIGVGFYQVNQKNGQRHSTATAYLKPVCDRPNLTIGTNTQATRLLWEGNRIAGVEYIQEDGATNKIKVAREVILCSGAINSPQLLMLSGIGPAEHLKALGIPVIVDLPGVGQNLQDHLIAGVIYECSQPLSLDQANNIGNFLKYLLFKQGPLTSNIAEAGGFLKTKPDLATPDLQLLFAPLYFQNHGFNRREGHYFSLGATLLHPQSRGYISLRSPEPLVPPVIQPNYLASEADWECLLTGIKISRQLIQASAFDKFRGKEIFPGSGVEKKEEIADYIRNTVETLYHPVGTCKMGNDPMAVVNSQLQVHGVQGLRVVDASIMPTIVSGNTNAPTIMIAEKAADL
ncbi:MAG: choline dehydrogenase, partial [Symploca sp. SIO1C4]|nr:choline dehydrogenase [Symploca sp. SIO1C4]